MHSTHSPFLPSFFATSAGPAPVTDFREALAQSAGRGETAAGDPVSKSTNMKQIRWGPGHGSLAAADFFFIRSRLHGVKGEKPKSDG